MDKKIQQVIWLTLILSVIITVFHVLFPSEITKYAASILRWVALGTIAFWCSKKGKLTYWIFFSMLVGIEFGFDFPSVAVQLSIVSKIFIKLIKTIIGPLIFGTLVLGIAGHGNIKQVGRMGWKSIVYFEIVTTIALFIGLFVVNITKPGSGIDPSLWQTAEKVDTVKAMNWQETILHIFPENIAKSVAEGQVLQIVVFSVLFAIALMYVPEKPKRHMLDFCEGLTEVMFKFTGLIMKIAPIAIGCALAASIGHMGIPILKNMFAMVGSLYLALAILFIIVFLPVAKLIKLPIKRFAKAISEPVAIAFATTSSESALPKAIEVLEKFGIPRKIVTFVLPTGYSFNLDGTTLYLALATVFCAQATNTPLSLESQFIIVFTLMLTSKGVAGVPRASLVILIGTLSSFNIPVEPAYIILGIDELMDMGRTATNVTGNCLASAVIAKWEGEDEWNETETLPPATV